MNISSVGTTSPLSKQLEANGLSTAKASLVQSDLTASQPVSAKAPSTLTPATRAAFDAKISADVLSGKLSAGDAAAVKKTMDKMDGGASASTATTSGSAGASATSAPAGGAKSGGGGGGGGGGGSDKTELSELVTVSGSTMTTVITYTDGTTSTTTAAATDTDMAKSATTELGSPGSAIAYSPAIEKGALVNQVA